MSRDRVHQGFNPEIVPFDTRRLVNMVGEILVILAVVALCLLFVHEAGSPYHR